MNTRVNRRGVALMSSAHVVNDLFQGAVPAMLPFLAIAHGYSNTAVAGLMLAATAISSVAQPVFGWWSDKRNRLWMIWGGMLVAAAGIAVAGFFGEYWLVWIALAFSGLGIAAFHPDGARAARFASGNSSTAMSVFALGGNIGYALGSAVTVGIIITLGIEGLAVLLLPAGVMAVLLILRLPRIREASQLQRKSSEPDTREDDKKSFTLLTLAVIIRSIIFFGFTTFIALYLIERFDLDPEIATVAVTVFLISGIVGTLLGGFLGDRLSRLTSLRAGLVLAVPALALVVYSPHPAVSFVFVAVAGVAMYMPFAVMVVLGQDYLPQHMGTASGVTVGLAVSIGGMFSPVLGWIADTAGLQVALSVLVVLPIVALLVTAPLKNPAQA